MKGYDRPLRPEYIYELARTAKAGDNIADHNDQFERMLWRLRGKEGKRKVKTVLSRYFLRTGGNSRSKTVADVPILKLCKTHNIEEVKPILLFYLMIRSPILILITKMINEIYGYGKDINYSFLRKKMIAKMGERDISARSLRNFLQTLENFDVLRKKKNGRYHWKQRLAMSNEMTCCMLRYYSEEFIFSPQIMLNKINENLLMFFDLPKLEYIAKKYNGDVWDYKVRIKDKVIVFRDRSNRGYSFS